MSQPAGTASPRAAATLSFPAAAAEVAMSTKNGASRSDGMAMQMGFVPSRASRPPNGATPLAVRPESAVMIPIMPASAAIRA